MRRTTVPALAAILGVIYSPRLRRRILTWGATELEASSELPGDELLEQADGVSTRAIGIEAPAAAVWPWLVQMGPSPRGGAYTYDWIENLLGLKMHSADHVLPDFQDAHVGDTIGLGSNEMRLERVEPGHVLAWRSADQSWVWSFVLDERNGTTRLISRNRFRLSTPVGRLGMLPDGAGVARDGAKDAAWYQAARRAPPSALGADPSRSGAATALGHSIRPTRPVRSSTPRPRPPWSPGASSNPETR
jgi:hypothetical protein